MFLNIAKLIQTVAAIQEMYITVMFIFGIDMRTKSAHFIAYLIGTSAVCTCCMFVLYIAAVVAGGISAKIVCDTQIKVTVRAVHIMVDFIFPPVTGIAVSTFFFTTADNAYTSVFKVMFFIVAKLIRTVAAIQEMYITVMSIFGIDMRTKSAHFITYLIGTSAVCTRCMFVLHIAALIADGIFAEIVSDTAVVVTVRAVHIMGRFIFPFISGIYVATAVLCVGDKHTMRQHCDNHSNGSDNAEDTVFQSESFAHRLTSVYIFKI